MRDKGAERVPKTGPDGVLVFGSGYYVMTSVVDWQS